MVVDRDREGKVFLLTASRLQFPQMETPFILQEDEGPHQSITQEHSEAIFFLRAL